MRQEAKTDPRRILPVWAPRPQAIPSFWHLSGRADFGWGPLPTDGDETSSAPGEARGQAYLMIQADPLSVLQVLEEVRSLEGVTEAHEEIGPFDIVALVEADGVAGLPSLLCGATFTIPGVYAAALVVSEPPPRHEEERTAHG